MAQSPTNIWSFDAPESAAVDRSRFFEMIRPSDHWKMPIEALVRASDFENCNEAAIWYTGGPLEVVSEDGFGSLIVKGAGYYANVGA